MKCGLCWQFSVSCELLKLYTCVVAGLCADVESLWMQLLLFMTCFRDNDDSHRKCHCVAGVCQMYLTS